MSFYTKPYFFYAQGGQSVNLWIRSDDFDTKIGVNISGSAIAALEANSNAWNCGDAHSASTLRFVAPINGLYQAEATSTTDGLTGSFKLYITEGPNASASLDTGQSNGVGRIIYSPIGDRIFSTELAPYGFPNPPAPNGKLVVINPHTYITTSVHNYPTSALCDCVYNSVDDNVWVWYSGSNGQYFDVYDKTGSAALATYTASVDFGGDIPGTFNAPRMVYNPHKNHILMVPVGNNWTTGLNYYIYDCGTHAMVYSASMEFDGGFGINCTYVTSSKKYYIVSQNYGDIAIKIDSDLYTSGSSLITSSAMSLTYIPEKDILVGGGNVYTPSGGVRFIDIYNSSEEIIGTVHGIFDPESNFVYDPSKNCIVVPDDYVAQNEGLEYIDGTTFKPANFVSCFNDYPVYGMYYVTYCNSTSTVWVSSWQNGNMIAVVSSIPTGSLPQP
jgi:hypothetical protein